VSTAKTAAPTGIPKCCTVSQLVERTGLSRATISRALSRGELEHYRMGSRAVIPESAVVAWLEANRISRRPRRHRSTEEQQP
jgi:excisionase family DNA binding protein